MEIKRKKLASYVDAMKVAARMIEDENPDFVVAPMTGSVPFIDSMAIVDPHFDPSKVVYMPASSRIVGVKEVIREWYGNFLDDTIESPQHFPKVIGIDEVVSGQSVIRVLTNVDRAINRKRKAIKQPLIEKVHSRDATEALLAMSEIDVLTGNTFAADFARIRGKIQNGMYRADRKALEDDSKFVVSTLNEALEDLISYKTIGIEDSKRPERVSGYNQHVEEGRVLPVGIETIITMDKPELCPVKFEPMGVQGNRPTYFRFSPVVKEVVVTREYVEFLQGLANYVGADQSSVGSVNMPEIFGSNKYLSKKNQGNE